MYDPRDWSGYLRRLSVWGASCHAGLYCLTELTSAGRMAQECTALMAVAAVRPLDLPVMRMGHAIETPFLRMSIDAPCTGLHLVTIAAALILAKCVPMSSRVRAVGTAAVVLLATNILRVASLVCAGSVSHLAYRFAHDVVWIMLQPVLWVVGYYWLIAPRLDRVRSIGEPDVSDATRAAYDNIR